MRVLILGGTREARALAELLVDDGDEVVTSLAGRVARPRLPVGDVRIGGYGGIDGLADHLREKGFDLIVDATHPFAERISANAAASSALARVPLVRLERSGWSGREDAHTWTWVDDHDEAARAAATLGERPFLTVGRQSLHRFVEPLRDLACVVRVVDPPEIALPEAWTLVQSRGPYTLEHERDAMRGTDVLVTKDSGGSHTEAKLDVAAQRRIPVVIVRRAGAPAEISVVRDAGTARAWVRAQSGG